MLLMTTQDARELGEALLNATDLIQFHGATTVSVEVTKGRAVAVEGDRADNTIVYVVDTLVA